MRKDFEETIIEAALKEDMPQGDITSESIILPDSESDAVILAKEGGVLAGIDVARRVFQKLDASITFKKALDDGQEFRRGKRLAALSGHSISILKGERTALNFLQRMSGIATTTRKFIHALEGTKTKILDTRKTTPGLRSFEKYAVRMGGGENHRHNLSEMVLIKDNHLRLVGNITLAVKKARERIKPGVKIEVEATSLKEVQEAVQSGADMILLDNMSIKQMREVVHWVKGKVPLEASGKVSLKRAREIASLGINFISVGSLTHSYKSVDISLEFLK
ncbi:MAG: carboxylating nicotinate-nucleotide diphosphorylase [Candidatus Aminicenantes bacterium]|nr:carboxylating nicotinate-nucleotide diphosphorylase [Candidatus Aminicenantes bacterium]MBL7083922.1 carboxylating nicotinate-nucleotide diphosphorylase [Candidatus Aminicenantes bacterium]